MEDAVFAAAEGDAVGPVRDALGWHTVAVVEIRPAGVLPLADVREEIAQRLVRLQPRRAG